MAGFQFMHAEVFAAGAGQARPAKKGGKVVRTNERKLSAAQVVGEAARLAGCAPHVSEPVTPRTLRSRGRRAGTVVRGSRGHGWPAGR